jgi:prepilin-type N-terminal cleavage/methylation domain-containing protein
MRAGFTLIEIMVVVGIMGLIALIGIPSIYQIAKKEGMRRAVTDMKDAETSTPSPNQINTGALPPDITFGMLQVNLLNYRESEWTRVRFFPNGTSDEMRLVLTSEKGEARGLELEPTTGLARIVNDLQEIRTWE